MKHFHLQSYGCQMNDLDSEVIIGMLRERSYSLTEKEEMAIKVDQKVHQNDKVYKVTG